MTDLEISEALALAIGWKKIIPNEIENVFVWIDYGSCKIFDYRDWNVIGPIAERYNCFPRRAGLANLWWIPQVVNGKDIRYMMDTPQKAIAIAVINAKNEML